MSKIRIAINGYGRIGRCTLRALYELGRRDEFEVVAINASGDLPTGIERIAAHTQAALLHVTSCTEPHGHVRIRIRALDSNPERAVDQVVEQLERDVRERPWAWWNWGLIDEMTKPPAA